MIQWLIRIIGILASIVSIMYAPRAVYAVVGFFKTRKFPKAGKQHKYAVMIAARNEEKVIGKLIESIQQQDYPGELVDIFVVADNCTDSTANIARASGAICYERQDPDHRTKGFALQFLVERIREDYGIESYEGYFIFDADNLLKRDYISRMNEAFDAGEKIITSFRNTKNFDDNWIAASYGLHWIKTTRSEHRARSLLRVATRVQGTGYLFANELIKDGWNYTCLTEDRALCADAVAKGYAISYNHEAVFYDEQPVDIRVAMRQRIRWAKGNLQVFAQTGGKLFGHIFYTGGAATKMAEKECGTPLPKWKRFLLNIRLRFMSFDMLSVAYPQGFMAMMRKIVIYLLRLALIATAGYGLVVSDVAPTSVKLILHLCGVEAVSDVAFQASVLLTAFMLAAAAEVYVATMFLGAYLFLVERKRIMRIRWYRKVWYCMTYPMFDMIGKITTCIALVTKVEWKPIPHNADVSIEQLSELHGKKEVAP